MLIAQQVQSISYVSRMIAFMIGKNQFEFFSWCRKEYTFLEGNPDPPASPQSKWVLAAFALFILLLIALCVLAFWLLVKLWGAMSGA